MNQSEIHSALFQACADGDLKEVQYYLTSKELKFHANINAFNNKALNIASEYGYLDIVKYLLLSPDLKQHADNSDDLVFENSCQNGHTHLIDFVLNEKKLNRKISLEQSLHDGLIIGSQNGQLEVIKYFVELTKSQKNFDLNTVFDEMLENAFFAEHSHVTKYLESLLLKKHLDNELSCNPDNSNNLKHKLKI